MKTSTRNLIIILLVLVAGFAAMKLTKRKGKSKNLRTELVTIDTAKVSKVIISSTNGTTELNKTEGAWTVAAGDLVKQAKASTVKSMLGALTSISPGRLAARKEDKWKDYAVDSTGTRVQVYEGNEVTTDIVLGRFGVEGQRSFHTFVRLFDDENVYSAPNFMKMNVPETSSDYRNGDILRLSKDSLVAIQFDYPDSAFTLTKAEKWMLEGVEADSASVVKYLQGLRSLSSKSFYDESVAMPSHTVTFSFSNQPEVSLQGYWIGEDWVIKSSENADEQFKDGKANEKVLKGKSFFLAEK